VLKKKKIQTATIYKIVVLIKIKGLIIIVEMHYAMIIKRFCQLVIMDVVIVGLVSVADSIHVAPDVDVILLELVVALAAELILVV
jgi:hypothetical protein